MPLLRTRVRALPETKSVISLACWSAVIWGAVWPMLPPFRENVIEWGEAALIAVTVAWLLVPVFTYALWAAFVGLRYRQALISGTSLGLAFSLALTVKIWLTESFTDLNLITIVFVLQMLLRWSLFGVLAGSISVAIMALFRALVFKVVEQDGDRCWKCTYPVGRSNSRVCSECGTEFKEKSGFGIWFTRAVARHTMLGWIMLIILLVGAAALIVRQQKTIRAFVSVFEYKTHPAIFAGFETEGPERGAFISHPRKYAHGQTAIVALHCPSIFEDPRIRIYGGTFHETHSNVTYARGRRDRIWCELTPEQTRLTLVSELPSALQNELIRIAADDSWNSRDPNGNYASLKDLSKYFTHEDLNASH